MTSEAAYHAKYQEFFRNFVINVMQNAIKLRRNSFFNYIKQSNVVSGHSHYIISQAVQEPLC